jgi:hypothetical protein
MAASEHATALCERHNLTEQSNVMEFIFNNYPSGVTYVHGDNVSQEFVSLLPDNVTAGAGENLVLYLCRLELIFLSCSYLASCQRTIRPGLRIYF